MPLPQRHAASGEAPTLLASSPGAESETARWRVTIARFDENASITVTEADPDAALAELVRYAQADAA